MADAASTDPSKDYPSDPILSTHLPVPSATVPSATTSTARTQSHTNSKTNTKSHSYTYYHAGPLFTIADLHANVLLSGHIRRLSAGKFLPVLPQDLEQRDLSPHAIRDADLRALLACDLALFNYEGAELDAGTVVEYTVAKAADVPCVILRTDFRGGGDQAGQGDAWNLMSSNWPRTVGVGVNAMVAYKKALAVTAGATTARGECNRAGDGAGDGDGAGNLNCMLEEVAREVIGALEQVLAMEPRLPSALRESVYSWIGLMPGFRDGGDEANVRDALDVMRGKVEKGLL